MGPVGCPETSVQNYHSTLCNIPEERTAHLHRGGSLKSLMDLAKFSPQSKLNEGSKKTNIMTEDKQIDSKVHCRSSFVGKGVQLLSLLNT
jgi:hypothetical protein